MKRVKNGRRSHRFMGRLLAGMTAVAVSGSSLAVPGNVGTVYADETETSGPAFTGPEVRSINLNIDGKIAGLEDPTVPESTGTEWSNGTGTYIYYAGIGRSRLLDADTTDLNASPSLFSLHVDPFSSLNLVFRAAPSVSRYSMPFLSAGCESLPLLNCSMHSSAALRSASNTAFPIWFTISLMVSSFIVVP